MITAQFATGWNLIPKPSRIIFDPCYREPKTFASDVSSSTFLADFFSILRREFFSSQLFYHLGVRIFPDPGEPFFLQLTWHSGTYTMVAPIYSLLAKPRFGARKYSGGGNFPDVFESLVFLGWFFRNCPFIQLRNCTPNILGYATQPQSQDLEMSFAPQSICINFKQSGAIFFSSPLSNLKRVTTQLPFICQLLRIPGYTLSPFHKSWVAGKDITLLRTSILAFEEAFFSEARILDGPLGMSHQYDIS